MRSVHCAKCDTRLFDETIIEGMVEIKCRKCGLINRIQFTSLLTLQANKKGVNK